MIIWRGWGIVGLFLIVGGMALVMGLSGHNSSDTPAGVVAVGAGLLLGGAACAALGYWLNVVRPRSKAAEYLEGVRRELWQRVRAGAFQVAVGAPAPRDEAEAAQQVEYLVSQQSREDRARAAQPEHPTSSSPFSGWAPSLSSAASSSWSWGRPA